MKNEQDVQDLFGAVTPKERTNGGVLTEEDIGILSTPMPADSSVYVLCTKHFPVFPISQEGRDELLSSMEPTPTDWTGKYIEVTGCPFCEAGRFENPVLKDYRAS